MSVYNGDLLKFVINELCSKIICTINVKNTVNSRKKLTLTINQKQIIEKNFNNLFDLIWWIVITYNLKISKTEIQNRNDLFYGSIKKQNNIESMETLTYNDVVDIVDDIKKLGKYIHEKEKDVERIIEDKRKSKKCIGFICAHFIEDIVHMLQREAVTAKSIEIHTSLEKYAKFIQKKFGEVQ